MGRERKTSTWPVGDLVHSLYVVPGGNVLVTCLEARKIKEYTTNGELVREVQLQDKSIRPVSPSADAKQSDRCRP